MKYLGERTVSAAQTLREMGITDAELEVRLQAVRYQTEDRERVRGLQGVIARFAAAGAEEFLNCLKGVSQVQPFLAQAPIADEIRRLNRLHMLAMAQGDYGTDYARQGIDLALLYNGIQLQVKWLLGAFHHVLKLLGLEIIRSGRDRPEAAFQDFLAVKKVAFFDIGLMVDTLIFQREHEIRGQQEAIRELSTPILQARPGLLILPLIGTVDSARGEQLTGQLVRAIRSSRARVVVLDITGVAGLDAQVANRLLQAVDAARLMGATTIVTGISPEAALAVATAGVDLGRVSTVPDLQRGLEEADQLLCERAGPTDSARVRPHLGAAFRPTPG